MKKLLVLVFLLIPSTAFAQEVFDVSCRNVVRIRIFRVDARHWNIDSYQGNFHVLYLELKEDAAKSLAKLCKEKCTIRQLYGGRVWYGTRIFITANGEPLQNDVPEMDGVANGVISIIIVREQDAFAAARMICPALVPYKVIMDGFWEYSDSK